MSCSLSSRSTWAALCVGLLLALVPLISSCQTPSSGKAGPEPKALPIFRLGTPQVSERTAHDLASRLFGVDAQGEKHEDIWRAQSGDLRVDVCAVSGGVWAADRSRMWKPDSKPVLPDESKTLALAQ